MTSGVESRPSVSTAPREIEFFPSAVRNVHAPCLARYDNTADRSRSRTPSTRSTHTRRTTRLLSPRLTNRHPLLHKSANSRPHEPHHLLTTPARPAEHSHNLPPLPNPTFTPCTTTNEISTTMPSYCPPMAPARRQSPPTPRIPSTP